MRGGRTWHPKTAMRDLEDLQKQGLLEYIGVPHHAKGSHNPMRLTEDGEKWNEILRSHPVGSAKVEMPPDWGAIRLKIAKVKGGQEIPTITLKTGAPPLIERAPEGTELLIPTSICGSLFVGAGDRARVYYGSLEPGSPSPRKNDSK